MLNLSEKEKIKLKELAETSVSYRELSVKMGWGDTPSSLRTTQRLIKLFNYTLKNYKGQRAASGKTFVRISVLDSLSKGISINSYKLKNRLFKEGIKNKVCECCTRTEWNGKEIPLELHHIDGDSKNNNLSNIQILCPNCHAQTENFCGRNTKGAYVTISDEEIIKLIPISSSKNDLIQRLGKKKPSKHFYIRIENLAHQYNLSFNGPENRT